MSFAAIAKKSRHVHATNPFACFLRRLALPCGATLGLLLAGLASPAFSATTYTFTSPNYDSFSLFTSPCAAGNCVNYTTSMHLSGSFTTATPLAANLVGADVRAQVTSFSFNDGLTTYSSSDPNVRLIDLQLSTDSSGVPDGTSTFIVIQQWASGSSPHAQFDRINQIFVDPDPDDRHNYSCTTVGTDQGVADACTVIDIFDESGSEGSAPSNGTWTVTAGPPPPSGSTIAPVPTLSTWSLGALAALVALFGFGLIRRKRRT